MNNKQFYIVLILLIILIALTVSLHHQPENSELNEARSKVVLQNFTTNIYIEKVEGNGNSFGDNNKIKNCES
jgi:biopolymer transport protein ExbD